MARSTSTTSVGLQTVTFATVERTKKTMRPVYQERGGEGGRAGQGRAGQGRGEVR